MNIPFISVEKQDYNCKLSDLISGSNIQSPSADFNDFSDEMLLLNEYSNAQISVFLKSLHSSKCNVDLKAVITDYNRNLSSFRIHSEIKSEHIALHNQNNGSQE